MFSILRLAVLLGLFAYFVPIGEQDHADGSVPEVSPFTAIGAAQAAVSDMGQFCVRNPSVCETGQEVASIMAMKAKNGVSLLSEYLDEGQSEVSDLSQEPIGVVDPITTAQIGGHMGASQFELTVQAMPAGFPVPRAKPEI